jgi:thioredoxin-like negative regulator of GroEL
VLRMSVTHVARNATMAKGRRRWRRLVVFLCGAGLVSGGWAWWTYRRYQRAMSEIESEIAAGRYAIACRNLEKLSSWKADPNGRIAYLLGYCELARGRHEAADAAWARVAPGSQFAEKAVERRMYLFRESGRLAAAERLVSDAAVDPGNDRTALLLLLVPVFREQGRIEEAERLIENRWEYLNASKKGALEPAIKLVRQHIELTLKAAPAETVRAILEQASQGAPDDDRVWLGRANLAIRTGALDEAKRWLDACRERRPEDVPVWRAQLSWGIATDRADVVEKAMAHMPATEWNLARFHQVNAWLAAHRGDVATERRELELLVAADPADVTAIGRLAELAEKESQPARAADLGGKKTRIDRLRARYLKLHDRTQPIRDAEVLARLAEQLGRRFEARAFLTIAVSEDPAREDLRLDLERFSASQAMPLVVSRFLATCQVTEKTTTPSIRGGWKASQVRIVPGPSGPGCNQ